MAFSENLREGIRSSFEKNGGIFGQALQYRREKQEHEKAVQQEIKTINKGTLRLSSTRNTLANLETSFLAISKNMQLIAKAYEAQVTLQEETNAALGVPQQQPTSQPIQRQAAAIQKQLEGPQKQEQSSLFDKIFDLLDDLGRKTRGGRPPRMPRGPKGTGKFGKLGKFGKMGGRLLGRVAGPASLAIGAYEASEFLAETGYGKRMAEGEGKRAQKAFKEKNTDFSSQQLTAQQAKDILDSNSKRDIEAFGGRDRLEQIAGIKKVEPVKQLTFPATGVGGGRGVVNPQAVTPTPEPAAPPPPPAGVLLSGSGEVVRSGSGEAVRTSMPSTPPPAPTAKPTPSATEDKKPPAGGSVIDTVTAALSSFGITNPFAKSAILANIEKESGFKPRSEDLAAYAKTSNQRIREVFTTRVSKYTDEELDRIKKDPVAFGEVVYGKETKLGAGMGNTQEGDGYKYRGRGFIQITGKNNYALYGKMIGEDLLGNPDKANEPWVAAKIAAAFIANGLKNKLDFSSQSEANRAVTQTIGGKSLNLNVGYGAEILAKVDKYSGKYINEASTAVASAKSEQQGGSTTIVVAAQQPDTKKAPVTQGPRKEYHTPIAA